MIFSVGSNAELQAAFQSATGGDRIELLPGEYNAETLKNRDFDSALTLVSADPEDPAVFIGALTLKNLNGVNVSQINFKPDEADLDILDLVVITGSQGISFTSNTFEGHVPRAGQGIPSSEDIDTIEEARGLIEGQAFARGIRITDSQNVTVQDNELSLLRKGIILDRVQQVDVVGNHLHDLRSDGVNLVDAVEVTIAGNLMESFRPLHNYDNIAYADHGDFIQWWAGSGGLGIRDLTIRDNALLQGAGSWVQGIFGRGGQALADGSPAEFDGIRIENNLINTSQTNGIFVGDARNVEISGNTLLPAPLDLTQPVITSGIPSIHVRTSATLRSTDEYDFSVQGALPQNVHITENIVVGEDAFTSYQIDPSLYDQLNLVQTANAVLSTDVLSHWSSHFPQLANAPVTDVTQVAGFPDGVGFDPSVLSQRLLNLMADLPGEIVIAQKGSDGADELQADGSGRIVDAGAGNDIVHGTVLGDILRGGRGSDQITTGAGADQVTFHRSDIDQDDVDVVIDLDFDAGDSLVFSGGFGFGFFDDDLDTANALTTFRSGDSAIVHDRADLIELVAQTGITAHSTGPDSVELRFDLDADTSHDWTLQLQGIFEIGEQHSNLGPGGRSLIGTSERDVLTGGSHADLLRGFGGDDLLIGGLGADQMYGGDGDDRYYVSDATDRAFEVSNNGYDRVYTSIDYTLGAHIEAISAQGTENLRLTGNAADNWITGNVGDDALRGAAGQDRLLGLDGDDWLDGGAGDDVLQGGAGADRYVVDAIRDLVIEQADEGYDRVDTSVDYQLGAYVEALTARGDADLALTGNGSNNWLTGNSGDNFLRGLDGNDRLIGRAGDDVLEGGAGGDVLQGGQGRDVFVFSHGSGIDVVLDFEPGIDLIRLDAASDMQLLRAVQTPSGVLIYHGALGDVVVLQGTTQSTLQEFSVFSNETPVMLDF